MSRMPPPEGPAPPHSAHGVYESGPWRPPYPPHPHYDHAPDPRRPPGPSPGPGHIPPQGYPVIPNRELPQLPPDGPYGRPTSLPAHSHPDPGPPAHPAYRPPNGLPPHDASPHSAPPDYRARMGFAPSEPPSTSESSPTSGPLPPTTQYMPPGPSIPAGTPIPTGTPGPYDPAYPQNPAFGARIRKAARATQACDQCRARKAKCDEGRPACSHCKENNLICVYKEVPPHKQEKTTQVIIDKLMEMEDRLMDRFNERFSNLDRQIANHDRSLSDINKGMRSSIPPRDTPLKTEQVGLQTELLDDKSASFSAQPIGKTDPLATSFEEQVESQDNEGELSIPVEHTTAAHKLLMWPSIKSLIRSPGYDEDYVMQLEKDRGITSVFGSGESSFTSGFMTWALARNSQAGKESLETPGTVLPDDLLPEPEVDEKLWPSLPYDTAKRYYDCYLNKLHKLHPFLDEPGLWTLFQSYTRQHCTGCPAPSNGYCRENSRGAKRKRSYGDMQAPRAAPPPPTMSPYQENDTASVHENWQNESRPSDDMSIDNATILLVLALGAICETPHPLPGPAGTVDYRQQYIPGPRKQPEPNGIQAANGVLSPANSDSALPTGSSFYTQIQSTSHSFPAIIEPTPVRKPISDDPVDPDTSGMPKNYRVIPGLFLFGYATMILGSLQGVGTLKSVQARLLAGLYAGQLAHPFQSHAWISEASRCCQVLIAPKSFDTASAKRKDMITFAFWTCLQLESDLLAELDIPASGISRAEGRMGLPFGQWSFKSLNPEGQEDTDDALVAMLYYSAQIHLRKVLNRVHTDLYKVESKPILTLWKLDSSLTNQL